MPYVDFFVPSVEELGYMLDRERYEEWQVRADGGDVAEILDLEKDIKPLADKCMALKRVTYLKRFFPEQVREIPVSQHS